MKLTKEKLKQIIKEELSGAMQEREQEPPQAPRDVDTLAQAMDRPEIDRAIDHINTAEEAKAAIQYLIKILGQKNLPVGTIIMSMAQSLAQTKKGGL